MTKTIQDCRESSRKREKVVGILVICMMICGLAVVLDGAAKSSVYLDLKSDEYLTDDSILYRDIDNATYTFDNEQIDEMLMANGYWVLSGLFVAVGGYVILLVTGVLTVSEKTHHRRHCDGSGEMRYCPECGLKLSRLDE